MAGSAGHQWGSGQQLGGGSSTQTVTAPPRARDAERATTSGSASPATRSPPSGYQFPDVRAVQEVIVVHFNELLADHQLMNMFAPGLRIRIRRAPEDGRPAAAEAILADAGAKEHLRKALWNFCNKHGWD